MILEFGAGQALIRFVPRIIETTVYFMFENKTIASAVLESAYTGKAVYVRTGRPLANGHQTWRNNYITYYRSHFKPAFSLLILVFLYNALAGIQEEGEGRLPMFLVIGTAVVWLIAPIIFTPFPHMGLLKQDIQGFMRFIFAPVVSGELQLATGAFEGAEKPKYNKDAVRSLREWCLANALDYMKDVNCWTKLVFATTSASWSLFLLLVLPARILDFLWVFLFVFAVRWIVVLADLRCKENNLLTFFYVLIWCLVPMGSVAIIGNHGSNNFTDFVVTGIVFLSLMDTCQSLVLFIGGLRCGSLRFYEDYEPFWVHFSYYAFMQRDLDIVAALCVLVINVAVSLVLILLEMSWCLPRGLHSWWLLNGNVAYAASKKTRQLGGKIYQGFVPGETCDFPVAFRNNVRQRPTRPANAQEGASRG
jgi:hypothetical protein